MTHQEPPKKTCQKCKDQTCLKTGKPCDEIERLLRSEGVKSRDWIRPRISSRRAKREGMGKWREIPFSSFSPVAEDKNPLLNPDEGVSNMGEEK